MLTRALPLWGRWGAGVTPGEPTPAFKSTPSVVGALGIGVVGNSLTGDRAGTRLGSTLASVGTYYHLGSFGGGVCFGGGSAKGPHPRFQEHPPVVGALGICVFRNSLTGARAVTRLVG